MPCRGPSQVGVGIEDGEDGEQQRESGSGLFRSWSNRSRACTLNYYWARQGLAVFFASLQKKIKELAA